MISFFSGRGCSRTLHIMLLFRRRGDRGWDTALSYNILYFILYYKTDELTGRVQHHDTSLYRPSRRRMCVRLCVRIRRLSGRRRHCTYRIMLLSLYCVDNVFYCLRTTSFVCGQCITHLRENAARSRSHHDIIRLQRGGNLITGAVNGGCQRCKAVTLINLLHATAVGDEYVSDGRW